MKPKAGQSHGKALFGWVWDVNQVLKNIGSEYAMENNVCYHAPGVGTTWFSIVKLELTPDQKKYPLLELNYAANGGELFQAYKQYKSFVEDVVVHDRMIRILGGSVPDDELEKRGFPDRALADSMKKTTFISNSSLHKRHKNTYDMYVGDQDVNSFEIPDGVQEALTSGDFPVVIIEKGRFLSVDKKLRPGEKGLIQVILDRKFLLPISKKAGMLVHVIDMEDGRVLVGIDCEEKRYRWEQYFMTVQL